MSQFLSLGFLGLPHGFEWIALVILGLLLFGKKLPGLARSVGQSVVEFKKGIKGVQDDANQQASQPTDQNYRIPAKTEGKVIETEATTSKQTVDAAAK